MTSGICHLGGLSSKAQEDTLRHRPDILVATPGCLIDHLQITSSLSLQAFAVLILDEAGRMRSDGMDSLLNLQKSFVLVPHQVVGQAANAGAESGRRSSPLQSPMRKTNSLNSRCTDLSGFSSILRRVWPEDPRKNLYG